MHGSTRAFKPDVASIAANFRLVQTLGSSLQVEAHQALQAQLAKASARRSELKNVAKNKMQAKNKAQRALRDAQKVPFLGPSAMIARSCMHLLSCKAHLALRDVQKARIYSLQAAFASDASLHRMCFFMNGCTALAATLAV